MHCFTSFRFFVRTQTNLVGLKHDTSHSTLVLQKEEVASKLEFIGFENDWKKFQRFGVFPNTNLI